MSKARLMDNRRLRAWCAEALYGVLAFALSGAKLGGVYAPWALGAVAAAGGKMRGVWTLLGAGLGALVFFDFQSGLRFAASAVLIFCARLAFCDSRLSQRREFAPCVAAGMLLLVQSVYLLGRNVTQWALCLCACATAALCAEVWGQKRYTKQQQILLLLTAMAVCTLPVQINGFSAGRAVSAWLVLLTAQAAPGAWGGLLGAGIGLASDLAPLHPMVISGAVYGCAGYAVSRLRIQKRSMVALVFALCGAVIPLALNGEYAPAMALEGACAALAFMLLPQHWLPRESTAGQSGEEPDGLSGEPLKAGGAAFRELYNTMFGAVSPKKAENPAVLFDRAAEQVCRGCVLQRRCWQEEYTTTYNAFNDATAQLLRRGKAEAGDFPPHFAARCVHLPELLHAIDTELYAFLLRRQYHRRLEGTRALAEAQFAQMGETLSTAAMAREGDAPELRCRVGTALRPKNGETLCGDQLAAFTAGQTMYLLLSDGMGSGEKAHAEAAMTVRLLRQFLKAGIKADSALQTMNTALTLHCQEGGGFTTIDLLSMERQSGVAALYKYGAAPSYLRGGGTVTRLQSESLPAGLQFQPPGISHLLLREDTLLVMVSDGVVGGDGDEWLQEMLRTWPGGGSHELATLLLAESRRHGGLQDDCAVMVLQIEKNRENNKDRV